MSEETKTIVIDLGSANIRAGFAGDDKPKIEFPAIVGHPIFQILSRDKNSCYVGNEARTKRSLLSLKYPIQHGIVRNWDNLEILYNHAFQELSVNPAEYALLITEPLLNPKSNSELYTQLMSKPLTSLDSLSPLHVYYLFTNQVLPPA